MQSRWNIDELRGAVTTDNQGRSNAHLREHLRGVERCAGAEALLREARSFSQESRGGMRARSEQLRTEAEQAKVPSGAGERPEELLTRA